MDYIQNVQPNIHVAGTSGMCLQYVDDGVNAPNRKWSAQASWDYAVSTGKAHSGKEPPQKVWVPVYYTIDNGQFAGLGHVAWYYNDGKNTVIYDSEYASGRRSTPYGSGSELIGYMGWQMRYLGWSEHLDGLDIVKPKPADKPKPPKPIKKEVIDMHLIYGIDNNAHYLADGFRCKWIKDEREKKMYLGTDGYNVALPMSKMYTTELYKIYPKNSIIK